MEDLRGMRVPFLRVGWNRQFLMMKEFGFVYDSSMVAPFSNPPLWPYTLDYKMPHACTGNNQHCPSRSYPGVWEMVMNQLEAGDYYCGMVCNQFYTFNEILLENGQIHSKYENKLFRLTVARHISTAKRCIECYRTISSGIMQRIGLHSACISMRHGLKSPNISMRSCDLWTISPKCPMYTL